MIDETFPGSHAYVWKTFTHYPIPPAVWGDRQTIMAHHLVTPTSRPNCDDYPAIHNAAIMIVKVKMPIQRNSDPLLGTIKLFWNENSGMQHQGLAHLISLKGFLPILMFDLSFGGCVRTTYLDILCAGKKITQSLVVGEKFLLWQQREDLTLVDFSINRGGGHADQEEESSSSCSGFFGHRGRIDRHGIASTWHDLAFCTSFSFQH